MARNGDRKVAIFPDRSAPFAYSTLSSSAQCGPVAARARVCRTYLHQREGPHERTVRPE